MILLTQAVANESSMACINIDFKYLGVQQCQSTIYDLISINACIFYNLTQVVPSKEISDGMH